MTDCTISGNHAHGSQFKGGGEGGGIDDFGSLEIRNSTFSGNQADVHAGNLYGQSAQIGNTVLNAGTPENLYGGVSSLGYNVCSDNGGGFLNGPGDQINTDPVLGPLQNNGGPTFTHELLKGSPAIDTGDPNFSPPPYYDQRGPIFWRVRNGRIDSGSFRSADRNNAKSDSHLQHRQLLQRPLRQRRRRLPQRLQQLHHALQHLDLLPTPRPTPTPRPRPTPPPRL